MTDTKKPYNAIFDLKAPLRGFTNIVNGRVFDPKSWDDELDVAHHTAPASPAPVKGNEHGDASEEVEESTTRRVKRGPRGTFTAASAASGAGTGGGAGKGAGAEGAGAGGKPPAEGEGGTK